MWLSLAGAILCVSAMFLISWWTALITLSVVLALYLVVSYRKPGNITIRIYLCIFTMIQGIELKKCFVLPCFLYKNNYTDVNWGSTTQAQTYNNALTAVQQLDKVEEHVKNYRPQLLVLTGAPNTRSSLIDFAHHITKHQSLFICSHIIEVLFHFIFYPFIILIFHI